MCSLLTGIFIVSLLKIRHAQQKAEKLERKHVAKNQCIYGTLEKNSSLIRLNVYSDVIIESCKSLKRKLVTYSCLLCLKVNAGGSTPMYVYAKSIKCYQIWYYNRIRNSSQEHCNDNVRTENTKLCCNGWELFKQLISGLSQ